MGDPALLRIGGRATAHHSGRPYEDLVAIAGRLEGDVVSNHLVNWLSPLNERIPVITGEKGAFIADTLTADLTFHANGNVRSEWDSIADSRGVSEGDMMRYAFPKAEPLRTEHENFRDVVLNQRSDTVTLEQGLATLLVAEACLDSAQIGRSVKLL